MDILRLDQEGVRELAKIICIPQRVSCLSTILLAPFHNTHFVGPKRPMPSREGC